MRLTLTLEERGRPVGTQSRSLERGELTIGRGANADWVLNDPQRLLSKLHCRVEARDGRFVVVDTSTNGVFVNQSDLPLGQGRSVALNSGDRLSIGSYTLLAAIADTAPRPSLAAAAAADAEWLPPRPADEPAPFATAVQDDWLVGGSGDATAPQQEFFAPPTVEKGGIPDDWFLAPAGTETATAPPPPPPPAPAWSERRSMPSAELPGAVAAERAAGDLAAHVAALHAAVRAVLEWLPADRAVEGNAVLERAYHAARARRHDGERGA